MSTTGYIALVCMLRRYAAAAQRRRSLFVCRGCVRGGGNELSLFSCPPPQNLGGNKKGQGKAIGWQVNIRSGRVGKR